MLEIIIVFLSKLKIFFIKIIQNFKKLNFIDNVIIIEIKTNYNIEKLLAFLK